MSEKSGKLASTRKIVIIKPTSQLTYQELKTKIKKFEKNHNRELHSLKKSYYQRLLPMAKALLERYHKQSHRCNYNVCKTYNKKHPSRHCGQAKVIHKDHCKGEKMEKLPWGMRTAQKFNRWCFHNPDEYAKVVDGTSHEAYNQTEIEIDDVPEVIVIPNTQYPEKELDDEPNGTKVSNTKIILKRRSKKEERREK